MTHVLTQTWPQLIASFMAFAAMGLVYTYLPTAFIHRGLPTSGWLMAVLAGYGLMNLVGNWIFGKMGDRRGAAPTVRLAQLLEIASLALLTALSAWASLPWMIVASWLFAMAQAYIPDLKALAADVSNQWRGTSLAFNNTAMYGGMMVGSAIANAIYHPGAFPLITALAMASIGVGLFSMTGARRLSQQRLGEA